MKEDKLLRLKSIYPGRLVAVSNRIPYSFRKTRSGLKAERNIGGLISALEPAMEAYGGTWIAWGEPITHIHRVKVRVPLDNPKYNLKLIKLSEEEISNYYYGFANRGLWPLCHYFIGRCKFEAEQWKVYEKVNNEFADVVIKEVKDGDLMWIHDYHLALLPKLIRERKDSAKIAFFWHIPFPPIEVFKVLPWREEILKGLLGSDLLGFHLNSYVQDFLDVVQHIIGAGINKRKGIISFEDRYIRVKAFPISIDFDRIEGLAKEDDIRKRAYKLRKMLRAKVLCIGVDRLDYTKGMLERMLAVEWFLERYKSYRRKFVFLQIAVPSRTKVEEYRKMKSEIEETVGRINGRFTEEGWIPIRYLYRSFPLEELITYYMAADCALITPLRDGMNLVAKEYVASRINEDGVLILSEFIGAAHELKEAIVVNPFDVESVAESIRYALEMTEKEKRERMKRLRERVKGHDIYWWLESFLTEWSKI